MALAGHGVRAATPAPACTRARSPAPESFDEQVDALVAVLERGAPAGRASATPPTAATATRTTSAPTTSRSPRWPGSAGAGSTRTVVGRAGLDAGLGRAGGGTRACRSGCPAPDELPSVPDETITVRLDVTAHRAARIAAMRAHATQIALWVEGDGRLVVVRDEQRGGAAAAGRRGVRARRPARRAGAGPVRGCGTRPTCSPGVDGLQRIPALLALLVLDGVLLGAFGLAFTPLYIGRVSRRRWARCSRSRWSCPGWCRPPARQAAAVPVRRERRWWPGC